MWAQVMEIICTHNYTKPFCKENFQKLISVLPYHILLKFDFLNIKKLFSWHCYFSCCAICQTDLNFCQHQNKLTHLNDVGTPFLRENFIFLQLFPTPCHLPNTLPISFLLLNFIIVIDNSMHNKCMMKLYEKLSFLNIQACITVMVSIWTKRTSLINNWYLRAKLI